MSLNYELLCSNVAPVRYTFIDGKIRAGNLRKLLLHIEAGEEFNKIKHTLLTSISALSMAHMTISAHSFQNSYTRVACGLCYKVYAVKCIDSFQKCLFWSLKPCSFCRS